MTAQNLKNSILQLAVQGKLVPQDSNDEPASELLKRTQAERSRFVKEKKIKEEKPLTRISEDCIPFDIPESWEWCSLLSVTYPVGDKASQILASEVKLSGKYPAISQSQNLIDGYCDAEDKIVTDVPIILFGDHTRNVKYIDFQFVISADGTKLLKPIGIDGKYLFYWMTITAELIPNRGYARHFSLLKQQPVPIPPLAEQKRIVAKIEELLPHIAKYDVAEKRLSKLNVDFPDKLRKSILQQAVQGKLTERDPADEPAAKLLKRIRAEKAKLIADGKIKKGKLLPQIVEDEIPFDIPDTWVWASIDETCTNIQYGTSNKSSKSGKVAVLRMGNLQNGKIDYENLVYTSNDYDIERCHLEYNDLLFNRTNSKELVGKTAIYKAEMPAIYAGYLIRITPIEINCDYLNYVMQSYYFKQYCQRVKTDAIGQSNINAEKLKRFIFPIPPLAEQQRIVSRVEELLAAFDKLK